MATFPSLPHLSRSRAALLVFCVLMLAACADEGAEADLPEEGVTTAEPVEPLDAAPADTAGAGARVAVEQQEPYGTYLTDADGRTLYLFTADTQGQSSACYDACAEAWPPLLAMGEPTAAASAVDGGMLGTIERRDGSMQVTYNGWPLYYYREDQGAGEVTGQDIHSFGGEWYLVSPQGTQLEAEAE